MLISSLRLLVAYETIEPIEQVRTSVLDL